MVMLPQFMTHRGTMLLVSLRSVIQQGLVELQYVAPQSNGLFRGAISESGWDSAELYVEMVEWWNDGFTHCYALLMCSMRCHPVMHSDSVSGAVTLVVTEIFVQGYHNIAITIGKRHGTSYLKVYL